MDLAAGSRDFRPLADCDRVTGSVSALGGRAERWGRPLGAVSLARALSTKSGRRVRS